MMALRLQRVSPMVSPQLPRPDTRGVTMRNTARQTRENRTITVDFRSEAIYFQLLGDRKAFLECVLAFVMALGFQLNHKATCRGGGCLTRHSHYVRVRLGRAGRCWGKPQNSDKMTCPIHWPLEPGEAPVCMSNCNSSSVTMTVTKKPSPMSSPSTRITNASNISG